MRLPDLDLRVLGTSRVFCDTCDKLIEPTEDRLVCLKCEKDYCQDCRPCTLKNHEPIRYRGFPRLEYDQTQAPTPLENHIAQSFSALKGENDTVYLEGYLRELMNILSSTGSLREAEQPDPDHLIGKSRKAYSLLWNMRNAHEILSVWASLRNMGRFVEYIDRRAFAGRLPTSSSFLHSQGSQGPMLWRNTPMMKTVWDFALTAIMFQEIKPRAVFELGSAAGASAMWYRDLQETSGIAPLVISIDIAQHNKNQRGIRYVEGNTQVLPTILGHALLNTLPHPWIVFEDSHSYIPEILTFFDTYLKAGDYIIIEDIDAEKLIIPFLRDHAVGTYLVDTRYTDYFGHNATSAADQIFCRRS